MKCWKSDIKITFGRRALLMKNRVNQSVMLMSVALLFSDHMSNRIESNRNERGKKWSLKSLDTSVQMYWFVIWWMYCINLMWMCTARHSYADWHEDRIYSMLFNKHRLACSHDKKNERKLFALCVLAFLSQLIRIRF